MTPEPVTCTRPQGLALRTLLYRYFFFAWLFKDVGRGKLFERAAAWRYNVEQARWLPTYMRRYIVCGLLLVALGDLAEPLAPFVAACFFVPGLVMVPMTAVAFIGWLWLRSGGG
jgi:hypothetical protein